MRLGDDLSESRSSSSPVFLCYPEVENREASHERGYISYIVV